RAAEGEKRSRRASVCGVGRVAQKGHCQGISSAPKSFVSQPLTRYCPAARRTHLPQDSYPKPMAQKVRIALDAMGGDVGPAVVVPAAETASARHPDTEFLFYGDEAVVAPLLDQRPKLKGVSRLVHTDVTVKMDEKPSQALRHGRWKSSMW